MGVNYHLVDESELEFVAIAEEGELDSGDRMFIEIDDLNLVVFNIAGKFFAIADVCSHDDGPLEDGEVENDHEVVCPRHGARFDVRTGGAKSLPAVVDIPAYPVKIVDGQIEVGIPLDE